jgi:hypothetical protein
VLSQIISSFIYREYLHCYLTPHPWQSLRITEQNRTSNHSTQSTVIRHLGSSSPKFLLCEEIESYNKEKLVILCYRRHVIGARTFQTLPLGRPDFCILEPPTFVPKHPHTNKIFVGSTLSSSLTFWGTCLDFKSQTRSYTGGYHTLFEGNKHYTQSITSRRHHDRRTTEPYRVMDTSWYQCGWRGHLIRFLYRQEKHSDRC